MCQSAKTHKEVFRNGNVIANVSILTGKAKPFQASLVLTLKAVSCREPASEKRVPNKKE